MDESSLGIRSTYRNTLESSVYVGIISIYIE